MAPYKEVNVNHKYVDIKMRCRQSYPDINRKEVKLIPKPFKTILPKEVKTEKSPQTKLLSKDEKQKTSSNHVYNEEINCDRPRLQWAKPLIFPTQNSRFSVWKL